MSQTQQSQIKLAPFRSNLDFFGDASKYSIPIKNRGDRLIHNLLFYQTNYILIWLAITSLFSIIHPEKFFIGFFLFYFLISSFIVINTRRTLNNDAKSFYNLFILIVFVLISFRFEFFRSIFIFVYSIVLPLIGKYHIYFLKNYFCETFKNLNIS